MGGRKDCKWFRLAKKPVGGGSWDEKETEMKK